MINEDMSLDDFDDDSEDLEDISLNLEMIKDKLPKYASKKLCDMIVCDRYFGCYKEMSIMCMEELAARRIAGDNFDFESYIDNSYKELPKLDFSIPDLGDVLRQAIGRKFAK